MTANDVRKVVKKVYSGTFKVRKVDFSDLARGDAYFVSGVKGEEERIRVRVAISTLPQRTILE